MWNWEARYDGQIPSLLPNPLLWPRPPLVADDQGVAGGVESTEALRRVAPSYSMPFAEGMGTFRSVEKEMGYTTDFTGKFTVTPALTPEQVRYLQAFNRTPRMKRDPEKAERLPDLARLAVGLPIGEDAGYFVGNTVDYGQARDASVVEYNRNPKSQPGLWCQWTPSDDGTAIEWDEGEKFYYYTEWLKYIVDHFLKPWGRELNGEVSWSGEDSDDIGVIYARGHEVQSVPSSIANAGPSWGKQA